MKTLVLGALFFLLLQGSCVEHEEAPAGFDLTGYWINVSFIDKVKHAGLGTQQFYCTEMNFDKDSVEVDNGFELYKLKYSIKDSLICLYDAAQGMNLMMKVGNENYIHFIEEGAKHIHANDKFNRVVDKEKANFKCVLNYNLIAGKYFLYNEGTKTDKRVEFTRNGEIKGSDFLNYELCYSGDCLAMPDTMINIITLKDKKKGDEFYAWTKDTAKKQVLIYELAPAVEQIKGGRTRTKLLFDLREQ